MHPAGLDQPAGGLQQPRLQRGKLGDVGIALQMHDIRVPPDGARGRARRIEQHGIELPPGLPGRGIRRHDIRLEAEPGRGFR